MRNAVAVQSSLLAIVAYDRRRSILYVAFRDGAAYQYTGVPIETYRGLLQADSKGAYFNHCIRDLYPYEGLRSKKPVTSS
jgi:KTSC domain